MRTSLCALCLAALCGCGPKYALSVPREVISRLPYESKVELLEAENALAVAVDRVDESENEVLRTRDAIRRAHAKLDSAKDEQWKSKDQISREVASLAIAEAESQLEYLRSRQEHNVGARENEDLALRCAFAQFEKARLAAAQRAKVEGSERLKPEDFDKQVKECQAELTQRQKQLAAGDKKVATAKSAWEEKRSALAKKTFDARASPYVE